MVISIHLPPPVMIESAAHLASVTHMLCCSWAMCFSAAASSENDQGSMNLGALIRLWKEKRGEAEPQDLSDNLVVQLGVATEALNRSWYERNTGRLITDVQRWVQHPVRRYMAAT